MPTDNKEVLSLVKGAQDQFTVLEQIKDNLKTLKTKFQTANPNISSDGVCLNQDQVDDAANMISGLVTFVETTHAAIIATINGIDVGSHKGNALD